MILQNRPETLQEWLLWQQTLHPQAIDLGLERCTEVARRLNLLKPSCPVISVAGTNGKGSCVALLAAIYRTAGYRTACFTSPHLFAYNERITLVGKAVSDERLCHAFEWVNRVRGDISLTYFEFSFLAALLLFKQVRPNVMILEVGLGGRLDAVNMLDADVALITSIDLDHMNWLGPDREAIGFEKAGIMRPHKPAVCADASPPQSLLGYARDIQAEWHGAEKDFHWQRNEEGGWHWYNAQTRYDSLPLPTLPGTHQISNAAAVLQVIESLRQRLPVPREAIDKGLRRQCLHGRIQKIQGRVPTWLDVSHNPQSVKALAETLGKWEGETHALTGILTTKDIPATLREMLNTVDVWHVAPLHVPAGADSAALETALRGLGVTAIHCHQSILSAFQKLRQELPSSARLIVFGSFHTLETLGQNIEWPPV